MMSVLVLFLSSVSFADVVFENKYCESINATNLIVGDMRRLCIRCK